MSSIRNFAYELRSKQNPKHLTSPCRAQLLLFSKKQKKSNNMDNSFLSNNRNQFGAEQYYFKTQVSFDDWDHSNNVHIDP